MMDFDLVISGGTVVTASDTYAADIGILDGQIAAIGTNLACSNRNIDAAGKFVLPGGVEAHCHIEQESGMGIMAADDYASGSISAAFGGNTTIVPFAAQHRGQSLREVIQTYHERAKSKAVIDYAFHLIISDPTEQVLGQELPALIKDGYTSFKVFLTYPLLKLEGPEKRMFHSDLVMQSGAYQNSTWVVGVAKAGAEDGHPMFGGSVIVNPDGEIVTKATSENDELLVHPCDLDDTVFGKQTIFDFARHRRVEHYTRITSQTGVQLPPKD